MLGTPALFEVTLVFVVGVGLLSTFLVRSVPRARWREPRHLLKTGLIFGFVSLALILPASLGLGFLLSWVLDALAASDHPAEADSHALTGHLILIGAVLVIAFLVRAAPPPHARGSGHVLKAAFAFLILIGAVVVPASLAIAALLRWLLGG